MEPARVLRLSHDYTREKQLAAAASFAARLARKHVDEIDRMFTVIAEGTPALPTPPAEITAVLWASYLGHMVGHLNSLVGREATAGILKQVASVQSGADRAH